MVFDKTPGKFCICKVYEDYLEDYLNEIKESGATEIMVVPSTVKGSRASAGDFLIIYYNPPITPPLTSDGSPPGITVQ